ncbi:Potassium/Sodium Hyperpolarization-Activated Cyclic Nucleotide-Gated Channel 4 [Manis pentadactyla]|nr:Potassium/Sodium Hyperpolarization-Activated Cyclic Nucleotide-Gated Channel 4 [Manis pentadactyla]
MADHPEHTCLEEAAELPASAVTSLRVSVGDLLKEALKWGLFRWTAAQNVHCRLCVLMGIFKHPMIDVFFFLIYDISKTTIHDDRVSPLMQRVLQTVEDTHRDEKEKYQDAKKDTDVSKLPTREENRDYSELLTYNRGHPTPLGKYLLH